MVYGHQFPGAKISVVGIAMTPIRIRNMAVSKVKIGIR